MPLTLTGLGTGRYVHHPAKAIAQLGLLPRRRCYISIPVGVSGQRIASVSQTAGPRSSDRDDPERGCQEVGGRRWTETSEYLHGAEARL